MLEPGHTIDRYVVDRVIGEGGMAMVYRVRHVTLGSWHALKVLTISNRDVRERLIQEGRVQASLQHPHVVAVHDVLDVNGAPGLLMEYIAGPTLEDLLRRTRIPLDEALTLFRALCSGMGHAHTKGLIHRDLKPANVMLQVTDQGVVPKITDFGLAKALEQGSSTRTRTRTGTTMGTPAYMPPEQFRDAGKVDRRADLYALGCILYQLVCGRPPFMSTDMLELYQEIANGDYPDPSSLMPDLPPTLLATISGLLAPDLEQRIPDCGAALQVLAGEREVSEVLLSAEEVFPQAPPMIARQERTVLLPESATGEISREIVREELTDLSKRPFPTVPVTPKMSAGTGSAGEGGAQEAEDPPGSNLRVAGLALLMGAVGLLLGAGVVGGALWAFWAEDTANLAVPVEPAQLVASPQEEPKVPTPAQDPAPQVDPPTVDPPEVEEPADPPEEEPVATPASARSPAAPRRASFRFSEAEQVVLVGEDGSAYHSRDRLPPGEYRVLATFVEGGEPVGAGLIQVEAGERVTLRCNARVQQCRK